jgi:hypothetical protein
MGGPTENPMPIRNFLRRWIIDKPRNSPEPQEVRASTNQLRGKTGLVLKSLLLIHESIEDAQAMAGYEGLPLQVEQIYWEVWGVLARNPDLQDPEEVLDQWMEDCIEGKHLNWEDPVT